VFSFPEGSGFLPLPPGLVGGVLPWLMTSSVPWSLRRGPDPPGLPARADGPRRPVRDKIAPGTPGRRWDGSREAGAGGRDHAGLDGRLGTSPVRGRPAAFGPVLPTPLRPGSAGGRRPLLCPERGRPPGAPPVCPRRLADPGRLDRGDDPASRRERPPAPRPG